MTNAQIILTLLGWVLLVYLSNRTLRRNEISRLKDRLVDLLIDLQKYSLEQLNNLGGDSQTSKHAAHEVGFSGRVTLIELRVMQFNHYLKRPLLNPEKLSDCRGVDLLPPYNLRDKLIEVQRVTSDFIEYVETEYGQFYFAEFSFGRLWENHRSALLGAIAGLTLVALILFVGQHYLHLVSPGQ